MKFVIAIAVCGVLVLSAQETKPLPSVFTAAQAETGRAAYLSSCVKCHNERLTGVDGKGEIPEMAKPYGKIPPLAGVNEAFPPFLAKWGSHTTQDLSIRIKDAVSGFPPPNYPKNDELFVNLTAYVLQVNGAKPGTNALTMSTAVEIRSITSR